MNTRRSEATLPWQPLTAAASLGLRLLPAGWHGEQALIAAAARELAHERARSDLQRLREATVEDREQWLARLATELENEHTERARALCASLMDSDRQLRARYEQQLSELLRALLAVPAVHLAVLQNLAREATRGLPEVSFVLEVPAGWTTLAAAAATGASDGSTAWQVVPRADRASPVVLIQDLAGGGGVRSAIDGEITGLVERLVALCRSNAVQEVAP